MIYDQLFLTDKSGRKRLLKLQDFNLANCKGNEVTVIRGIQKRKRDRNIFSSKNHPTQRVFFEAGRISNMFLNLWSKLLLILDY